MKSVWGQILGAGFFLAILATGIWYYHWTGREQKFIIQPEIKTSPVASGEALLQGNDTIAFRFHSPAEAEILQGKFFVGNASRPKSEIVISVCADQKGKLGDVARTRLAGVRVKIRLPQDRLEDSFSRLLPSEILPDAKHSQKEASGYPVKFSLPCPLARDKDYWLVVEAGWKYLGSRPWRDDYISLFEDPASQAPAVAIYERRSFGVPWSVKATEAPEYGSSVKAVKPILMSLEAIKPARENRKEQVTTIWAPPGEGKIGAANKFRLNYRARLFRKFSAPASGDRLEGAIYVSAADPPARDLVISLAGNKGRNGWLKQDEPRAEADQLDFTSEIRLASTRVTVQPAKSNGEYKHYQRIPFSLYYPGIKAGTNYWLMLEPGWRKPDSAYVELLCGPGKAGESFWRIFERAAWFPGISSFFSSGPAPSIPAISYWRQQETGKEAPLPSPDSNTFFLGELELLQKTK